MERFAAGFPPPSYRGNVARTATAGTESQSSTKYLRNIGDKEKKSEELKFDFLGLYRPAVIRGNSNTPSALGVVMPLLHWAMPSRYHSIHKNDLARAMVAQSEQAFLALAQDEGPAAPVVKILEYKEMEPFFVAGGGGAPGAEGPTPLGMARNSSQTT